ncbi:MAG: pknD 4 [Mucilaginibacter sp.]|nr:pknD 4 [Mucilaginibacter sp.]
MRIFLQKLLILICFIFCAAEVSAQTIYDWTGAVSTDWSNPANWQSTTGGVTTKPAATYPGPADQAKVGVVAFTNSSNFPVISPGGATSVGSIVWGTEIYTNVSLVVNTTFTVNGDINNTSAVAGNGTVSAYTFTLSGTGTLIVTGNLNIGYDDGFSTSNPGNNNSFAFISSLNHLNITGNAFLNVYQGDTNHRGFVPELDVTGGTLTTTSVQSILTNSTSANKLLTANLSVGNASGSPAATLQLTGAAGLPSFSPYVTNTVTFNNPGATVEYSGGGSQSVYTDTSVPNLNNTISYYSIKFSGTGVKTALSGNLNIAGDFTNTMANDACGCNSVSLSAPLVNFNGTTQSLYGGGGSGTTFYNVDFSNSGTKSMLSGSFNLASTGILTMMGSSAQLASGNQIFTLLSDANSSAAIATIPSGCLISGQVNVQRYLTGNHSNTYRDYRFLSSPVNLTSTTSSLTNYISIAYLNANFTLGSTVYHGAFTAGLGGTSNGFNIFNSNPTVYFYKEMLPISNVTYISGKHIGVNKITATTVDLSDGSTGKSIPVGNGYILYFLGPNTRTDGSTATTPDNATLTASGYLNQQNVQVNLWYAPTGGTTGQLSYTASLPGPGFNMVGNPYACTINLSKVITDNSGSINSIYMLSAAGPSQYYTAYTANGSSAPNLGYAVSGSGFLVHATAVAKTLIFHESEKAASQALTGVLMGRPTPESQPLTGLYMKLEQDSAHYTYCGIYFRYDWSDKFESEDAVDLNSSAPLDIASLSADGFTAAVNHMPDYTKGSRIRLYTNAATDGAYAIKIEGIRNIDTLYYDIWLVDHYKNDSLNVRSQGSYAFNIVKSDTATYGNNRFVLAIRRRPLPPYSLLSFTGQRTGDKIKITWKTSNEGTFTNFVLQKQGVDVGQFNQIGSLKSDGSGNYSYTDANSFTGYGNVYRLQQQDPDAKISYSQLVSIADNLSGANKNIIVYPNPASSTIQVHLEIVTPSPFYKAYIYGANGNLVQSKSVNGNAWSHQVDQLLPGAYIIQVFDKTGNFIGENKFSKK